MTVTQERTAVDRQRLRQSIRYRMLFIAGFIALFIVFAVQTGTRYVLNDWTRDKLERVMEYNIHRETDLGKTSWSLGLNGLIISTSRIQIQNKQDPTTTFMSSGYSEIGVPLIPLLAGEMQVRSLRFVDPQFFAIRITPKLWNFSDLPQVPALRNIAYIDVHGGKMTLLDQSRENPARWSPQHFQEATFHLERPFERNQWPFSLSFSLPKGTYKTTVTVTGIGNGRVDQWATNEHTFALRARQINLADFQDLFPVPPMVSGVLNVDMNGQGIPSEDFQVHAIISSPTLTVNAPAFGPVTIKNGVTAGDFNLSDKALKWSNVVVHLGGFDLHSDGSMVDWKTKDPAYDARFTASAANMENLAKFLPASFLPKSLLPTISEKGRRNRNHVMTVEEAIYPAKLTGSAFIDAHVTGKGSKGNMAADLSAANISMASLSVLRPFQQYPIIGVLGANPTAKLNIAMHVQPTGRSRITNGSITLGNSRILLNGYTYLDQNRSRISFFSNDLDLHDVIGGIKSTTARMRINRALGLPDSADIALSGHALLNGMVDAVGDKTDMHAIVALANAGLQLNDGAFRVNKVNGRILANNDVIYADNLTGIVGNNGPFRLAGYLPAKPGGRMDVVYQGKTLDLAEVKSAALALKINSPFLANPYLKGRINNIYLLLQGTQAHPIITFTGQPVGLAFQKPGMGSVLVTGGTVQVHDNVVYLQNLTGTLGKGAFSVTGNLSTNASDIVLQGRDIDISYFRQAMIDLKVKAPIVTEPQVIFGNLAYAQLAVKNGHGPALFQLRGSPTSVYYQPKGVPKTFVLTGGQFYIDNNLANFNKLTGTLGKGTFTLTGNYRFKPTQLADVAFSGHNLDLSNIKTTLLAFKVKSPLLAEAELFGQLSSVDLDVKGPPKQAKITLTAYPRDVSMKVYGSNRAFHLIGGLIKFANDDLVINQTRIVNGRSSASISLEMDHLSHKSRLRQLHLATQSFDIGDLSSYLSAPRTPPMVRDKYAAALRGLGITKPFGKLAGNIDYSALPEGGPQDFTLAANIRLINIGFSLHGVPVRNINGQIYTADSDLLLNKISGAVGNSTFGLNGTIADVTAPTRTWQATAVAQVDPSDILSLLPTAHGRYNNVIQTSNRIPVSVNVAGNMERTSVQYTSNIAANSSLTINTAAGSISKPANQAIALNGSMVYQAGPPPSLTFNDSTLTMGDIKVAWAGTYTWPPANSAAHPVVNFTVSVPNPVPAAELISLVPIPQIEPYVEGITGRVGGQVTITGEMPNPKESAQLSFYNIGLPKFHLSNISGNVSLPDLAKLRNFDPNNINLGGAICINSLSFDRFKLTNIHGDITSSPTEDGREVTLKDLTADAYGGEIALAGTVLLNAERPFDLKAAVCHLDMAQLATEALQKPGQLAGTLDAQARVEGKAKDRETLMASLTGNGAFQMYQGNIKSLGQLETGITALRLLKQGLLGLNLSNIIATLSPQTHAGSYEYFAGTLKFADNLLNLNQMFFQSKELAIWGQGQVDIVADKARIRCAGQVPKVSPDLPRPLRHLSIAGLMDLLTHGALANVPDIPIIGSLSEKGMRAYTFELNGDLKQPETFTQSFKKTFHWLPKQPRATSPVYGISAQPEQAID